MTTILEEEIKTGKFRRSPDFYRDFQITLDNGEIVNATLGTIPEVLAPHMKYRCDFYTSECLNAGYVEIDVDAGTATICRLVPRVG